MDDSLRSGSQPSYSSSTPASSLRATISHSSSVPPGIQSFEEISNTPLTFHPFGSRFLPHLPSRPLCLLPVLTSTLLLVGTAEGLFVFDPAKAEQGSRPLIIGIAVRELKEVGVEKGDQGGTRTPRGGVVALVGAMNDEEEGGEVRVWQLGSLVSLARYAVSSEVSPVPASSGASINTQVDSFLFLDGSGSDQRLSQLRLDSNALVSGKKRLLPHLQLQRPSLFLFSYTRLSTSTTLLDPILTRHAFAPPKFRNRHKDPLGFGIPEKT